MAQTIIVKGRITQDGKLEVELPEDHFTGEVMVEIRPTEQPANGLEDGIQSHPATIGEIFDEGLFSGWEHVDIPGEEWVRLQREQEEKERGNWTF